MPDRVVAPLRESRVTLTEGLRQLLLAASAVESAETAVGLASLETAVGYLRNTFLPVAEAEEFTFYIAVDGVLGAVGATDVMKTQHASIAVMTEDLGKVFSAARTDGDVAAYARYLLPLLHGLYALVLAHLEAEYDVYLPLLDLHLSESQVKMLVDNINRISAVRRDDAIAGRRATGSPTP